MFSSIYLLQNNFIYVKMFYYIILKQIDLKLKTVKIVYVE